MKVWRSVSLVIFLVFLIFGYDKIQIIGDKLWHILKHENTWEILSRTPGIVNCSYSIDTACSQQDPPPQQWAGNATDLGSNTSTTCPAFFQWIHHDLAPWERFGGITEQNLEQAKHKAGFRVVIVDGQLYTEAYRRCPQSRAMFTLWGLLMLLERFQSKVPDVDLMFNCQDRPAIRDSYKSRKSLSSPPAMFSYCANNGSLDIPFPDWSYWGWPEVNIGAWKDESKEIFQSAGEINWTDRQPMAYWKGNPQMAKLRRNLLKCNSTEIGANIYAQDWISESRSGFKNSKLSKQCDHRYKIYVEGAAWSVSFKYILACGSTMLNMNPEYSDFFMRGLIPMFHYWPISRDSKMCQSIHDAVQWGNSHPIEAETIGRHGQDFLKKQLSMDRVYDYMFHLIREYAKLQRFNPKVPPTAQLLCRNALHCIADHSQKEFLDRTPPHVTQDLPCSMVLPGVTLSNLYKLVWP